MHNPTTPRKPSPALPHTPSRSSPLSTRPQNTVTGMFSLKMLPSPPSSPPNFLAPKRLFKPIPVFTSREKGRETRRNLFLKKVKSGREDRIVKSRGGEDEVYHLVLPFFYFISLSFLLLLRFPFVFYSPFLYFTPTLIYFPATRTMSNTQLGTDDAFNFCIRTKTVGGNTGQSCCNYINHLRRGRTRV